MGLSDETIYNKTSTEPATRVVFLENLQDELKELTSELQFDVHLASVGIYEQFHLQSLIIDSLIFAT